MYAELDVEAWERKQTEPAFERTAKHATRLKRLLSPGCGHWIDGGELYRYYVAKLPEERELVQLYHCEPCAREDARY